MGEEVAGGAEAEQVSGFSGSLDLKTSLNPEQLAAVMHGAGPQLVIAGAGSGKTRVITYRIAWLIDELGVEPWRIVAVTFTNKAAREMRERVHTLLGGEPEGLFVGTFHGFALRLLRRYGNRLNLNPRFAVIDSNDQLALVRRALAAEGLAETSFPPRAVLARISAAKSRLVRPDEFEREADGFFERRIAPVYFRYQGLLFEAAGLDFDDLLLQAVRLLEEEEEIGRRVRERLEYLLVDEFQDTNFAQLRLIHALVGAAGNLTAVGDEDQGIYRWRGAELRNILEFERTFPDAEVRKLERNYRSTQTILDASGVLVAHNEGRRGKRLWTDSGSGELIELYQAADEGDEARWVIETLRSLHGQFRYGETSVLMRTNAQTRALEEELLRVGIPYCLVAGVRFYDRAEVKDLLAYLRLIHYPHDNLSLLRVLNRPARGIGEATRQALEAEATELGRSLWDALRLDRLGGVPSRGAKALRAFRVLVEYLQGAARERPLEPFLELLLERTGYLDLYEGDDPDAQGRRENLGELLSAAIEFCESAGLSDVPALVEGEVSPLVSFLDHVALVTDVDGLDTEKGVSLMTLHSAKGLEFPVVVITGLEDGLLPHFNAGESQEDVEEERRLLYVGMTRAARRLFLTTCRRRRVAGRYQDRQPSPFLAEIPEETLLRHQSPTLFADARTSQVASFFDRGGSRTAVSAEATMALDGEAGTFGAGVRVRHSTLGEGTILDLEGAGESAKVTVYFDRVGKRRLVAKYAALQII